MRGKAVRTPSLPGILVQVDLTRSVKRHIRTAKDCLSHRRITPSSTGCIEPIEAPTAASTAEGKICFRLI